MKGLRLDQALVDRRLVATRSQAESYVKLGKVLVNGKPSLKPAQQVKQSDKIEVLVEDQFVSRAALKLASVADSLGLDFKGKIVLDVGSSTGGFTDFALHRGATRVIAVDVGTNQLHPKLRQDNRVELHEKTDIRGVKKLSASPDIVVIDVSFISLRQVLPAITMLAPKATVIAMVKPQFETNVANLSGGVIKNDSIRRQILKDFEQWVKQSFVIVDKADSQVSGAKGNQERFYSLKKLF